jgi:HTH-type transcriptional regulator/antitoxin MqsA
MSNSTIACPICGATGAFTTERYDDDVKHNGQVLSVHGLERSRCSACDSAPVMTDQIRRNQLVIADAKRRKDGLLSGDEIRKVREKLGLAQSAAATAFGGGGNAFSKYERGEVIQSFPMDRLLRLAVDLPGVMAQLASYVDGSPPESHVVSNQAAGPVRWQDRGALVNRQVVPQRRIKLAV